MSVVKGLKLIREPNYIREKYVFDKLHDSVLNENIRVIVVRGELGTGKTSLVNEYLHDVKNKYTICWFTFTRQEDRASNYSQIYGPSRLPDVCASDFYNIIFRHTWANSESNKKIEAQISEELKQAEKEREKKFIFVYDEITFEMRDIKKILTALPANVKIIVTTDMKNVKIYNGWSEIRVGYQFEFSNSRNEYFKASLKPISINNNICAEIVKAVVYRPNVLFPIDLRFTTAFVNHYKELKNYFKDGRMDFYLQHYLHFDYIHHNFTNIILNMILDYDDVLRDLFFECIIQPENIYEIRKKLESKYDQAAITSAFIILCQLRLMEPIWFQNGEQFMLIHSYIYEYLKDYKKSSRCVAYKSNFIEAFAGKKYKTALGCVLKIIEIKMKEFVVEKEPEREMLENQQKFMLSELYYFAGRCCHAMKHVADPKTYFQKSQAFLTEFEKDIDMRKT